MLKGVKIKYILRGVESRGNKVIRETAKSSKAINFRRIFVIRNVCRVTECTAK